MLTRKGLIFPAGRLALLAASAGVVVAVAPTPSTAASEPARSTSIAAKTASSDATDFSARRRYYRRGPSAAGLAFMGVATGLIAGAIAEQRRRDYYENNYYYGPGPYYGGPGYYGGGPYYGPRYYYQPY
jgi:hypothetical protein